MVDGSSVRRSAPRPLKLRQDVIQRLCSRLVAAVFLNGLEIGEALLRTVSVSTWQQCATHINRVHVCACVCVHGWPFDKAFTMSYKSHSLVSVFRPCTLQTHHSGGLSTSSASALTASPSLSCKVGARNLPRTSRASVPVQAHRQ